MSESTPEIDIEDKVSGSRQERFVMFFDRLYWRLKKRSLKDAPSIVEFVERMHKEVHENGMTGMHCGPITLTKKDRSYRRILKRAMFKT